MDDSVGSLFQRTITSGALAGAVRDSVCFVDRPSWQIIKWNFGENFLHELGAHFVHRILDLDSSSSGAAARDNPAAPEAYSLPPSIPTPRDEPDGSSACRKANIFFVESLKPTRVCHQRFAESMMLELAPHIEAGLSELRVFSQWAGRPTRSDPGDLSSSEVVMDIENSESLFHTPLEWVHWLLLSLHSDRVVVSVDNVLPCWLTMNQVNNLFFFPSLQSVFPLGLLHSDDLKGAHSPAPSSSPPADRSLPTGPAALRADLSCDQEHKFLTRELSFHLFRFLEDLRIIQPAVYACGSSSLDVGTLLEELLSRQSSDNPDSTSSVFIFDRTVDLSTVLGQTSNPLQRSIEIRDLLYPHSASSSDLVDVDSGLSHEVNTDSFEISSPLFCKWFPTVLNRDHPDNPVYHLLVPSYLDSGSLSLANDPIATDLFRNMVLGTADSSQSTSSSQTAYLTFCKNAMVQHFMKRSKVRPNFGALSTLSLTKQVSELVRTMLPHPFQCPEVTTEDSKAVLESQLEFSKFRALPSLCQLLIDAENCSRTVDSFLSGLTSSLKIIDGALRDQFASGSSDLRNNMAKRDELFDAVNATVEALFVESSSSLEGAFQAALRSQVKSPFPALHGPLQLDLVVPIVSFLRILIAFASHMVPPSDPAMDEATEPFSDLLSRTLCKSSVAVELLLSKFRRIASHFKSDDGFSMAADTEESLIRLQKSLAAHVEFTIDVLTRIWDEMSRLDWFRSPLLVQQLASDSQSSDSSSQSLVGQILNVATSISPPPSTASASSSSLSLFRSFMATATSATTSTSSTPVALPFVGCGADLGTLVRSDDDTESIDDFENSGFLTFAEIPSLSDSLTFPTFRLNDGMAADLVSLSDGRSDRRGRKSFFSNRGSTPTPKNPFVSSDVIVIFMVGGITLNEYSEIQRWAASHSKTVYVGSTRIGSWSWTVRQLFSA